MSLSISELARAREATAALLDELGLDAYLFEVESGGDQWSVRIDCALDGEEWQSVTLPAPKETLLVTARDAAARERILEDWRRRLASCKLQPFAGP